MTAIDAQREFKKKPNGKQPKGRKSAAVASCPIFASSESWSAWVKQLQRRAAPRSPLDLLSGTAEHPLFWGVPRESVPGETSRLLSQLTRLKHRKKVATRQRLWLERSACYTASAADRRQETHFPLELIAWCYALPQLAGVFDLPAWQSIFELAVATAQQPPQFDHPWSQQLLFGELPLTLAYLFPDLPECVGLGEGARAFISSAIVELTDGEGMPAAANHAWLRPLLASYTRCGWLARASKQSCFSDDAFSQLQWLAQQALRLLRHDGSQVLQPQAGSLRSWFFKAATIVKDPSTELLSYVVSPDLDVSSPPHKKRRKKLKKKHAELPEPGFYSEWATVALLRAGWHPEDPQLALTFESKQFCSELSTGSRTLWSGPSELELKIDGRPLVPASDWEEICWFSDDDVDYLELEMKFAEGWSLQRQVCLTREDRLLFLADAVLGSRQADISYTHTIPLAQRVSYQETAESHEGLLAMKRPLALVMPLALPEWRGGADAGGVQQSGGRLVHRQQGRAQRLYTPLLISLDRRDIKKPMTWRRLTVAEHLEVVRPEIAVGYRLQINEAQWLIYRSLAPCGNRSVLGQNFSNEFVFARFDMEGEIEELVEVEQAP